VLGHETAERWAEARADREHHGIQSERASSFGAREGIADDRHGGDSLLRVVRARQRCEERDEVVDIGLRQRERLDILVEPRILQAITLVVMVADVPERLL
jgi:hypothetical protein